MPLYWLTPSSETPENVPAELVTILGSNEIPLAQIVLKTVFKEWEKMFCVYVDWFCDSKLRIH